MDSRELWMKAFDLAQERPEDWWREFEVEGAEYMGSQVVLDGLLNGEATLKPGKYQPVPGLDVWLEDDRWKEGEIKEGDRYLIVNCVSQDIVTFFTFYNGPIHRECVSRGLAHKTKAGALARAKVCGFLPESNNGN